MQNMLCGQTVVGIWQLWSIHLAAGAVLYCCMYFTSHVKQKCKVRRSSRPFPAPQAADFPFVGADARAGTSAGAGLTSLPRSQVLVLMDEEGAVKAIPLGPPLAPNTI